MERLSKKIFLVSTCLLIIFVFSSSVLAITQEECEQRLGKGELNPDELRDCEAILDNLYQETGAQKRSLESEVKRFNTAIAITVAKILKTTEEIKGLEKEIASLSIKIGHLDVSLDQLSEVLIRRVAETYKKGKIDPLALLFSSKNFSEFVSRYKYLQVIQIHDRRLMVQMETTRTNYEDQKTVKEEKQEELEAAKEKLESQKILLAQQKADRERLLEITQNNEKRYQQLLATTRAEIEAIQRIIAGEGECSEVGKVGQGQKIASLISGPSACSLGAHLHFEIREDGSVKNPFAYLRNINLIDDSGGDPYSCTGDWDWPLNEPIRLTQGFGADTAAIRAHIVWYPFHTGIDIVSDDLAVKATKPGTLFRCAIGCGGGTLRYVQVDHDDSNLDTYYLHVNY